MVGLSSQGSEVYGFPATILADICDAVLSARDARTLDHQQRRLAERCELLLRSFARVGIIALVDEATGYQRIREERALAAILERFITEVRPWTRTFPPEFYQEIPVEMAVASTCYWHYTNDIVYDRLVMMN